jgi:hypothetical protein
MLSRHETNIKYDVQGLEVCWSLPSSPQSVWQEEIYALLSFLKLIDFMLIFPHPLINE